MSGKKTSREFKLLEILQVQMQAQTDAREITGSETFHF